MYSTLLIYSVRLVYNATRQVVAGFLHTIAGQFGNNESDPIDCVVTIWTQSWLDSEEYTMKCENGTEYKTNNKVCATSHRKKRGLVGGPTNIPITSEDVTQSLNRAVSSIAAASGLSQGQFT